MRATRVQAEPTGLTIESIQREVAAYFDVKLADLKGPKRHRAVAHPRMIAMYLARKHTELSLGQIGAYFGGRDHSTVLHAWKRTRARLAIDSATRTTLEQLCTRLQLELPPHAGHHAPDRVD